MSTVYRGDRRYIAILGRCNTGKSSVLNFLVGQRAAIVSADPGTTGDPVQIAFELPPLGPVSLVDTAGVDEGSALGELRRESGRNVLERAALALVVTDEAGIGPHEEALLAGLRKRERPFLVIFNKRDKHTEATAQAMRDCAARSIPCIALAADRDSGAERLLEAIVGLMPESAPQKTLVVDLLPKRGHVVCVTPIDASAPAGRLIAPQASLLRELIEADYPVSTVQPQGLSQMLALLAAPPALVITDSQAVREVAGMLPEDMPLTTFSVLLSRQKGDFSLQHAGARAIGTLESGARVHIAEACSHHPQGNDIARVKIPALLQKHLERPLNVSFSAGRDFPEKLEGLSLILHCGGCMLTPLEMRGRLERCRAAKVPVSNFGMAIAAAQGLLERVCAPLRTSP